MWCAMLIGVQFFVVVEHVMLASLHELLLTKCALIYWIFSTSALISHLSVCLWWRFVILSNDVFVGWPWKHYFCLLNANYSCRFCDANCNWNAVAVDLKMEWMFWAHLVSFAFVEVYIKFKKIILIQTAWKLLVLLLFFFYNFFFFF